MSQGHEGLVWQHRFPKTIVFENLSISIDGQQILQFLKNIDFLSFDNTAEAFGKWQFFLVFCWFAQIVTLLHAYADT